MDEQERAFRKARNAAAQARTAILADTRAEVLRLLKLARERIQTVLAAQPTDYQQWYLPQLQREIERALAELGESSAAALSDAAGDAWRAGQDLVDDPLEAAGVRIAGVAPAIDTGQLLAMRAFMTDRIKDVSVQAANRINAELGLTAIGAQSVNDTVKRVAEILGEGSRDRAFTIVRTELSRAYAVAAQERLAAAAQVVPGLKKEWRRSGKLHPRPHHRDANRQIVDYDQPFTLVGPKGIVKMMFPHDPAAPAGETINCGCIMLPRPTSFRLAAAFNPNQPRDRLGRWTASGMAALAADAAANPTRQSAHDLGPVSPGNIEVVRRGLKLNLAGYRRIATDDMLRHAVRSHGTTKKELLRGQRALKTADFGNLPRIVDRPQSVQISPKLYRGLPAIEYRKTIGRETYVYVEAVSNRTARVSFVSFRVHVKSGARK